MTSTQILAPSTTPAESAPPPRTAWSRWAWWAWWGGLSVAAITGIDLIGASFGQAIRSGPHQYILFWSGVLAFMIPAVAFVATSRSRGAMLLVVASSGLFLYVPKILRNPFGPTYHDELAHWRQVQEIASTGHLFQPNTIIPIIQDYPGLHIVTLAVMEFSGLSIWGSAMTVLAVFHVIDLLAVFLIVEGFTHSARAGAIGAVLYSLNSSYMYFHTQFAYESLGVMLFLVAIVAVQRVESASGRRARYGWAGIAAIVGAACAITHHLSTAVLCLVLVGWSAVARYRAGRDATAVPAWRAVVAVTGFVISFFVGWIVVVAPGTFSYLQPYFGSAVKQLTNALGGGKGGRTLFGASPIGATGTADPAVERLLGFASPLLILVLTATTLLHLRRRRRDRAAAWQPTSSASQPSLSVSQPSLSVSQPSLRAGFITLFVFGLLYFPSLPFLLAPSGAEGARRTWGFTYLGVALVLSPTVAKWLRQARRAARGRAWAVRISMTVAFVVVLIGNVAAGLDESYRFPGPYAIGSDTGSQTPELAALAHWFSVQVGPDNKVVTDRFTALEVGTYGRQTVDAPSPGFPTYQLWLDRTPPSADLVGELESSNYRYLVIDKQMTLPVTDLTGFFSTTAAASSDGTRVVTAADLNRFAEYGWLSRVYESADFAVYRFQYGSIGRTVAGQ